MDAPEQTLTNEQIRDFVIAGHGNLPRVREMLMEHPDLLNASYQWSDNDSETALQAAAQAGSTPVAEYLLERGAPLDICTAAMLGKQDAVEAMLAKDPGLIHAKGAHGISLMAHVAWSNNVALANMLFKRGAADGMSHALGNAVMKGNVRMARWIIENGHPDFSWRNYEGKSLLDIASEAPDKEMIKLLKEHGAG
jgi:ankyrin repeat protein